jgi:DNA-binding GntR family transcriptional regulator
MPDRSTPTRQSNRLQKIIEERIATCRYLPGLRLAELVLSTEFNTSRTPIFEILMQLFTTGLIVMWPRCGTVVAEISSQRL